MAITNIDSGKAGKKAVEVLGIKELEAKISDLLDATVATQAVDVIRDAARVIYDSAMSNLKAVNAPHEVQKDLFIYGKQPGSQGIKGASRTRKNVSALVGLKKAGRNFEAQGYVTWEPQSRVGKYEKTQRTKTRGRGASLVLPGITSAKGAQFGKQRIGENLGTMWELGTTLMPAKPWFRPAVAGGRDKVLNKIASGYSQIIASKTKTG